jgi:hypothetical protein
MHTKPYLCRHKSCQRSRQGNGFTTRNDLGRHVKSCHTNGLDGKTKSWQCAGKNCRDPTKVWPRYDNFKQHVVKMHSNEDREDVIKRFVPTDSLKTHLTFYRSEIIPGAENDVHANAIQVVDPANLSNPAPAPGLSPIITISTPDTNIANSGFTPINSDNSKLSPTAASLAVPSPTRNRNPNRQLSASPSSNDHNSPSAIDDASSYTTGRKSSVSSVSKSSMAEREERADDLLHSLLQSISEALSKSSSRSRKLELFEEIKKTARRLSEDCVSSPEDDRSPRDVDGEVHEGGMKRCEVCNKMIKRSCDMKYSYPQTFMIDFLTVLGNI